MLAENAVPGSTVEVDRMGDDERAKQGEATDSDTNELKITIVKPKERVVAAVGADGGGGSDEGDDDEPSPEASGGEDLPDEPEVLPDVPDAPPPPEDKGEGPSPKPE